jgi:hypothetical protein
MSLQATARQPEGAPRSAGGQFAPTARGESDVHIDNLEDLPLAPGVSEDDRVLYTHVHCEQLAWALHQATGWPYAAVADEHNEQADTYGWIHLGVMAPGGQVLDVEGLHDVDDVLDAYGYGSQADDGDSWLVVSDRLGQFGVLPDQEMSPADVERATRVAGHLLAAHGGPGVGQHRRALTPPHIHRA